ncbi:MAG: hypothetical protein C0625_07690 [Arcobacter sp.]|nr:MAG: hypothetical protein C0625_07690 [Arcobacter sp.]
MKKFILALLISTLSLLASQIEIKDAYVRATPPNLPNSAAFMKVVNHSDKDIAIIKARSTISKTVELHTHDMSDGIMKMYQVPEIIIPAKGETLLQPSGFHIMIIGLNQALKEGEKVKLEINFSNGESKIIEAPIKSVMDGMMNKMDHSKHMKHKQ